MPSGFHQKNVITIYESKIILLKNHGMQISCSTSYIFSIGYSLFQKVSRTSYVSQETFLGSKNLFWRKKKINGIFFFFFFLWAWWGWSWILLEYLRVSPGGLGHLFILFAPLITKQNTNFWNCIHAKKHLVITLRYLAGCSQQGWILKFR